jgi:phospholipid/cholesterol/gamma-HCH transport system substrate-binding protein
VANSATTTETLTGAAVLLVAAGFFIYATSMTGGKSFSGGYRVSAEFDNIEGVHTGTDVRMAGIKIGTVVNESLSPESFQAKVDMMIDKSVSLSEDTTAKITSEGLLGGKFIALDPGGSDVKLADGGVLSYTQGAVDIWSLISQAMFDKSGAKPATPGGDAPPQ